MRRDIAFDLGKAIRRGLTKRMDLIAAQNVVALKQGDLDCLGGLYAILNAITVATPSGLTSDEAWRAMRLAINNLADRRTAMDTFTNSMAPRRAFALAKVMGRYLSNQERQIKIEQAPRDFNADIEQVFAWIEASLAEGMPVVVKLEGETCRYTVVSRMDRRQFFLFDGGHQRSIKLKDCGVHNGLHRLKSTNMFRVKYVKLEPLLQPSRYIRLWGHKVVPHG